MVMGKIQKDNLFSIGVVFIASLVGFVAFGYPSESSYFPRVLAAFLGVMALLLLVRTNVRRAPTSHQEDSGTSSGGQVDQLKAAALVFGGVLGYLGAIKLVNYEISTVLFLIGFIFVLGYRNVVWMTATAVGLTLLLYVVFFNFLAVARPESLFF